MLRKILRVIAKALLSLRYKIEVKGLEKISGGGNLFLPNHPSELDPVILFTLLDGKVELVPVVADNVFTVPIIGTLLKKIGVLPIPDVDLGGNDYTKLMAKKALSRALDVLRQNKNLLIYPAGHLKSCASEELGGASGVYQMLEEMPDVRTILVRTTGLWGSSFSKALTHASPNLGKQLVYSLKRIVMNGIFFMPRRHVLIEFAEHELPRHVSKSEFNRYLEAWYNRSIEHLKLVPELFWSKELPVIQEKKNESVFHLKDIPEHIQEAIREEIAQVTKRSVASITPEANLARDLGMDSLDVAQLIAFLDDRYEAKNVQPKDLETVLDAMGMATSPKVTEKEKVVGKSWHEEHNRPLVEFSAGKTIQEVFLHCCERMTHFDAIANDNDKPLTYKQLKMRVLLLARKLKELPGEHIGILLPATAVSTVLVLAALFAKKVPVMLNWTVGSKSLREIVQASHVEVILTSQKFLRQAKVMDVEGVEDLFVMMEDVGKEITFKNKLQALIDAKKSVKRLLKEFQLEDIQEEESAVLLFTSGTESTPKGVPLSHKNIMSNQKAAVSCVKFIEQDVMYSFLPPFHSFGFCITGLLPVLCGLKSVYAPDPTDGVALARGIEKWRVTFLCAAPTFLKGIFHAADKEQLKSLRLVVSGAEKAPKALFEALLQFKNIVVLEGYGITECGPILTLNRPEDVPKGVGRPLPGVEIKIVHLQTHEELPVGQEGLIIARSPGIFSGYLQKEIASPFLETWYVTGDLGYVDEHGALVLSGRLKRFVKVGGEMINLLSLEEALLQKWPPKEEKATFALAAKEQEGERPELVLFTTVDLALMEVNNALKEAGFSALAKISKVVRLETIPLLGTGKINYRELAKMLI